MRKFTADVGWNPSKKTKTFLLGHGIELGAHIPSDLIGQQEAFIFVKPGIQNIIVTLVDYKNLYHTLSIVSLLLSILSKSFVNKSWCIWFKNWIK